MTTKSSANLQPEHQLINAALNDNNGQQKMLAITFGVIATVLAIATMVIAYLQLRRHVGHSPASEVDQPGPDVELANAPSCTIPDTPEHGDIELELRQ
ncbi:hypothetical protein CERZMDRAFT_98084 [Cercospora zeae-maydis SCOH1-5]|uniref:Uncharacterized protein n=1 Tax=Cercospora zeae-maydis SCOH1-5 TaxID=717836 RepID=A0A6A6FDT1_9PEZI|nr:hypothetical protein CERZMDRAFT_98084 [Cercospora zeae-maydis SCOH1-5]